MLDPLAQTTKDLSRRTLLALPGSLMALSLLPQPTVAAAPAAVSLAEFLVLSARLTGKTGLSPEIAQIYLTALTADTNQRARLADLAHGRQSHPDLEREIILSWYTGTYKSGKESRVATYHQALMWKTLGIRGPGTCGGPFGFWAKPPAEAR